MNIGSFVYKDTDAASGSVSFNNIAITGAIAATIDIINNASFQGEVSAYNADGSANTNSTLGVISPLAVPGASPGLAAFMPAGDVVRIAIPKIDTNKNLSFSWTRSRWAIRTLRSVPWPPMTSNCRARPSASGHIERVNRLAQEAIDLAS